MAAKFSRSGGWTTSREYPACSRRRRISLFPRRHASGRDSPATLANAAAQDDDRRTATRHLAFSETAISRSPAESGESWAAHYSPGRWAHESGMILSRPGDLDAAEDHLHLALDIHGLDRRRTRAIVLADLGGVRLRQRDMDGTLSAWNEFIECADGIRSVKVRGAVEDMRLRLNRFHGTAVAEELRHKADQLMA
ncbi:hypothetical protein [Streptomyces sp. NBC_01235]|uniref:hypothetical protein n=1 Tax=Streptomyces sp. NBC_01235 TaxID=2903788 RepID=UPI002E160085|nr:hypothetical protein OG289_26775 [Streptomyces sp. NBC_01235]